jgi:hypothetical protein
VAQLGIHFAEGLLIVLNDRGHQRVLGLEVVVHVAERDVGGGGDVGQSRPLHAVLVEDPPRGRDQALALPPVAPGGPG